MLSYFLDIVHQSTLVIEHTFLIQKCFARCKGVQIAPLAWWKLKICHRNPKSEPNLMKSHIHYLYSLYGKKKSQFFFVFAYIGLRVISWTWKNDMVKNHGDRKFFGQNRHIIWKIWLKRSLLGCMRNCCYFRVTS